MDWIFPMLLELTISKTVYRKRGEALGTRLRRRVPLYHPWEQERRKYAKVGKSLLKSNVNLNCYSDLKTNAATIFYSLDCIVFVNCRYIIVVIIIIITTSPVSTSSYYCGVMTNIEAIKYRL